MDGKLHIGLAMKKQITQIFIIAFLLLVFDYIFFILKVSYDSKAIFYIFDYLVKSILFFLILVDIFYKRFFDFHSSKYTVIAFVLLPLLVSLHVSHRLIELDKFYFYSKSPPKENSGNLWQFDDKLGHRAIANSKGSYDFYVRDSKKVETPVFFDSLGYRTVPDPLKIDSDKTDLYLGCSFTFGDYVNAEETYPYLTSKILNHGYINAGASAYGLAQMYQRAFELIPKKKFTYVFIQLSPWLADRAMEFNGPTFFGYRPFPYFSDFQGGFILNYPAYKTSMYEGIKHNWRGTGFSYLDKLHFSITDGFGIEILDYYSYVFATIKGKLGLIQQPTSNKKQLERYFYDQLIDLSKSNSAIPVILKLGYESRDSNELISYLSGKAIVVDLDEDLNKLSKNRHDLFKKYFELYYPQGQDQIWFDGHPNPVAHRLFSNKIIESLNSKNQQ
jgi:hypothetical protein